MKKLALILSLLVLASCSRQNLFCRVTLQVDSAQPVVALTVDNSMEAFDGVAAGADGTARRVRSAQYATMLDAVTLTADEATVTLKLLELQ